MQRKKKVCSLTVNQSVHSYQVFLPIQSNSNLSFEKPLTLIYRPGQIKYREMIFTIIVMLVAFMVISSSFLVTEGMV